MESYIKSALEKIKKKSWKTTLIGWLLIVSGVASVFLKVTNWLDAIPLLVIGIGFVFTEDAKNEKK